MGLERVESKERYLNNQFDELGAEYRRLKDVLRDINTRYSASSEKVAELTRSLEEAEEKLEDARAKREERGNSMTDTKPLQNIKAAVKSLRSEIKFMELRIGVVGHHLMQSKSA